MTVYIRNKASKRYAKALLDLADEQGNLDIVTSEMDTLSSMLSESKELRLAVSLPVLNAEKRIALVDGIATAAKFSDTTRNFLFLLAQNKRLNLLVEIVVLFKQMVKDKKGICDITVVSAVPLTSSLKKDLGTQFKQTAGSDVIINERVDASIIGGLVITYGSKQFDDSVKTKLERLKNSMKGTA